MSMASRPLYKSSSMANRSRGTPALDVTDLAVAADGNYAWSVKVTGGPGYSGLDNTADGGSVAGTRPSDSSEGTKSLKSGTDVTTLAKNPWILGFGNTPISSTTIHKQ